LIPPRKFLAPYSCRLLSTQQAYPTVLVVSDSWPANKSSRVRQSPEATPVASPVHKEVTPIVPKLQVVSLVRICDLFTSFFPEITVLGVSKTFVGLHHDSPTLFSRRSNSAFNFA